VKGHIPHSGGGTALPRRDGEYGRVDLMRLGQESFLRHRGGDERTTGGGSDGDGWWFGFNDRVVNFEARSQDVNMGKTAHRHGDWTHV
jgi:hypothetical protein